MDSPLATTLSEITTGSWFKSHNQIVRLLTLPNAEAITQRLDSTTVPQTPYMTSSSPLPTVSTTNMSFSSLASDSNNVAVGIGVGITVVILVLILVGAVVAVVAAFLVRRRREKEFYFVRPRSALATNGLTSSVSTAGGK